MLSTQYMLQTRLYGSEQAEMPNRSQQAETPTPCIWGCIAAFGKHGNMLSMLQDALDRLT